MASTHDTMLIFSNAGKVYWLRVFEVPESSRQAKGRHISALLPLKREETIASVFYLKDFNQKSSLVMCTRCGIIKKTALQAYANPRSGGIIAITLGKDDELIDVQLGRDSHSLVMATHNGMAIRFPLKQIREIGRTGQGVKGISLEKDDYVVGMTVADSLDGSLVTITDLGYGKRTRLDEYRVQGRAGKGLINVKVTPKTGKVVGVRQVEDEDELMLITTTGTMLRMQVSDIKTTGRNTQGVKVIRVQGDDRVGAVAAVASSESDEEETE